MSNETKSLRELISVSSAIRDALADGKEFDPIEIRSFGLTKDETAVALRSKIDSIAFVLDDLTSMGDQLDARAKLNKAAADRFYTAAEKLRSYLKGTMELHGINEVAGSDERFKLSPAAMRVMISDVDALPKEFVKQVIINEPQKDLIKKALESFQDVPGAKLEGGTSLRRYAVKPKGRKESSENS